MAEQLLEQRQRLTTVQSSAQSLLAILNDLAVRLRQYDPDLQVLYLSGYSDRLFAEQTWLFSEEAYLDKPALPPNCCRPCRSRSPEAFTATRAAELCA